MELWNNRVLESRLSDSITKKQIFIALLVIALLVSLCFAEAGCLAMY